MNGAYRFGLLAIALTDRDGVYGVVRAPVKMREVVIKLGTAVPHS